MEWASRQYIKHLYSLPAGLIGVGLFVVGLRAFCYSQLTYVTASMLANSLPKTDLRIVQVGGGIKELYYYPSTTVQVCMWFSAKCSHAVWVGGNVLFTE